MMKYLLALNIFVFSFVVMSQTNQTNESSPAKMMREMRLRWLNTSAAESKVHPSAEFPRVFAVVMDFPMGTNVITVLSSAGGDASLYTTATFGVIGGIGHEKVRSAAMDFVKSSQRFYSDAGAATDRSYPQPGEIFVYLAGFDGLRVIKTSEKLVQSGTDPVSELFGHGQKVITELRLTTEKQKSETNSTVK